MTRASTGETAKLKSKSGFGLDLQYGKILSEKSHLLVQAGYAVTNFKDITDDTAVPTINHLQETQKSFALGFAYEITPSLHIEALAIAADRTFVLPTTVASDYELKSVMIPGAEANLSWDFVQTPSYAVGGSLIGEFVAPAKTDDVEIKSAFEPVGALYWASKFGHDELNYRVTLTMKRGHQHTDVSEQKEDLALLGLMVFLPLGH